MVLILKEINTKLVGCCVVTCLKMKYKLYSLGVRLHPGQEIINSEFKNYK